MRRATRTGWMPRTTPGRTRRRRMAGAVAVLLLPLVVAGCSVVGGPGSEFGADGAERPEITAGDIARRYIDAGDVGHHVGFLAADERSGRGPGSEGLLRAAAWIAESFRQAGLEPAGDDGGFLQYWTYRGPEAGPAVEVPNVVGVRPGADTTRAGEYVVVVAHYDHLGVGEPTADGDSIYNGADDNASGVAAMVEVAEAFGRLPGPVRRPVLFLAVSGKEQGRLGSTWFTEHPTVDLTDAVAVLNMDMIGRNHADSIAVVGGSYSSLGPLVEEIVAATPGLGLSLASDPAGDVFRRSDAYPFARRGVPGVRFFSGLHDDYHEPTDEAGAVDDGKVARVARLVFLVAHRLATGDAVPGWTETGRGVVGR